MHERASTHPVFAMEDEEEEETEEEKKKKKNGEMVVRHADKINKLVYKSYTETNNPKVSTKFPSYFSVRNARSAFAGTNDGC
jgi:hypothetical protein